jgi:hypothetical protein
MAESNRARHGRSDVSLRDLVSAGLLRPGSELHLRTGETARVTKDGQLQLGEQMYRSPSSAANSVRSTNVNGWLVWKVRVKGKEQSLHELRASWRQQREPK